MMWLLTLALTALTSTAASVDGYLPPYTMPPVVESGIGTVYGLGGYHGSRTANGNEFEPHEEATCAHRTRPLGSWMVVRDPDTGRQILCHVTDRGPYVHQHRDGTREATVPSDTPGPGERWHGVVDMSVKATEQLGVRDEGLFRVELRYWSEGESI